MARQSNVVVNKNCQTNQAFYGSFVNSRRVGIFFLALWWESCGAFGCLPCLSLFCLTNPNAFRILLMKTYSTIEVAKLLGIGNDTLHRWIHTRRVPAPPLQSVGGLSIRLWTKTDIEKVREYKRKFYWGKGSRRRKPTR